MLVTLCVNPQIWTKNIVINFVCCRIKRILHKTPTRSDLPATGTQRRSFISIRAECSKLYQAAGVGDGVEL